MARCDLTGQVTLITGAAGGLGGASALALAEHGADLLLADINVEGLERTADAVRRLGRRTLPLKCDVSSPEEIRAMFHELDRDFGRIDFLANIAGEGLL